jgi:Domain of unknown function (DUF5348)
LIWFALARTANLVFKPASFIMTDKEGTLRLQASGRWAIMRTGREPFELTSGDVFRVEVDGKLQITCMGHLSSEGYYSIEGYTLRDGMRAAIGVEALPRKKAKMSDQGKLCRLPAGRWAIICPGRPPVAIVEGEVFELEVAGEMKLARMERRHRPDGPDEWVAAQGYELGDGLRAGFDRRERHAKPL